MADFTSLQEYSDSQLIEELSNRFDDFILAARKVGYGGTKSVQRRRYWKGDMDACIGLLHGCIFDCLSKNWGLKETDINYDADV